MLGVLLKKVFCGKLRRSKARLQISKGSFERRQVTSSTAYLRAFRRAPRIAANPGDTHRYPHSSFVVRHSNRLDYRTADPANLKTYEYIHIARDKRQSAPIGAYQSPDRTRLALG